MSILALAWAKKQKAGGVAAKAVLMILADYADEEGLCWPSQATIATETELTDRSVRDQLTKLEAAGLITREEYRRRDGTQGADRVRLAMSDSRNVVPDSRNELPPVQPERPSEQPEPRSALTTFEPPLEQPTLVSPPAKPAATPQVKPYPDDFEAAWKAYPHVKGRSSKPVSAQQWQKLPVSVRVGIAGAAARYAKQGREPRMDCGAPAMERWLRDQKFLDWLANDTPAKPAPTATPEIQLKRVQHYRDTGEWRPAWGDLPEDLTPRKALEIAK